MSLPRNTRPFRSLPGSTLTQMQRQLWTDSKPPESIIAGSLEQYRSGIPLGKIAEPQDIADAVLFLHDLSRADDADYQAADASIAASLASTLTSRAAAAAREINAVAGSRPATPMSGR